MKKEIKAIKVSLCIEDFECSAEEMSDRLGMIPEKFAIKGKISPGAKVPSKVSWVGFLSPTAETEVLDKQILGALDRIKDLDVFKKETQNPKISIGISVVVHLKGKNKPACSMFIANSTLARVSELEGSIGFDIYG